VDNTTTSSYLDDIAEAQRLQLGDPLYELLQDACEASDLFTDDELEDFADQLRREGKI
jgi:hypothetical protein